MFYLMLPKLPGNKGLDLQNIILMMVFSLPSKSMGKALIQHVGDLVGGFHPLPGGI